MHSVKNLKVIVKPVEIYGVSHADERVSPQTFGFGQKGVGIDVKNIRCKTLENTTRIIRRAFGSMREIH